MNPEGLKGIGSKVVPHVHELAMTHILSWTCDRIMATFGSLHPLDVITNSRYGFYRLLCGGVVLRIADPQPVNPVLRRAQLRRERERTARSSQNRKAHIPHHPTSSFVILRHPSSSQPQSLLPCDTNTFIYIHDHSWTATV